MLNYVINFSYYKQDYLFENAKFNLEAKDKVALIADIAKGKTTLFEILCGLNNNFQGTINGKLKNEFDENITFSFLPSEPVFFKNKSVYKNLEYVCKVLKFKKPYNQIIDIALKEFEIENIKNVKIKKLTYLEKQKVAFARSFIKNPSVVLIDDLFLNVKNEAEERSLALLIEKVLGTEKVVVVATTGYLNESWKFNKFATIANKQIETFNSLDNLLKKFDIVKKTRIDSA